MRAALYFVLAFILALVIVGTILVIAYNNEVTDSVTGLWNTWAPVTSLA